MTADRFPSTSRNLNATAMGKIVDIAAVRAALDGPDRECITEDREGRPMYLFALDWTFEGKPWTVQIWAYDWADAEARVGAMCDSLTVTGRVHAQGPL